MTSPGAALTALEAALTCRPGRWIRREGRSTWQIESPGRSRGQRERSSGLRRASTDPWEPSIAVRDGSPELRDLSSDQARRHRTRKSFGLAPQATKRPSTAGQNEGVLDHSPLTSHPLTTHPLTHSPLTHSPTHHSPPAMTVWPRVAATLERCGVIGYDSRHPLPGSSERSSYAPHAG